MKAPTLISLIAERAEKSPQAVAIRQKRFGIWRTITWKSLYEKVLGLSAGLAALGMQPGECLSVIGDNAPEWIIAEFAVNNLGGACNGIYQDMQAEELTYLINASESRMVIAEDQEQADKLIAVWDRIKNNVRRIVIWDSRGMSHYFGRYPQLVSMDEVMSRGREDAHALRSIQSLKADADAIALMLPTSGTTGLPKLCMISHTNLLHGAEAWQQVHPLSPADELFSLLPLAWMGEQLTVCRFLHTGAAYNFPEGKESVRTDFHEIQPTVTIMSPRMYEDICSQIRARMEDASFFKRKIYDFSLGLGIERAELLLEGKKELGFVKGFLYALCMFTTLRGLRQRVGLGRMRLAFTGGAGIGREVFSFYVALGINLMQLYGMTENCAVATVHREEDVRPETVGKPLPSVELRIGDDGIIYVKSPTNIKGYYKNPEATQETFRDGWLMTGDSGYFDEYGHLVVLDRHKDIMYLNDGTRFAPQELENRLKFSPYIREAVVFGNKRDMITTMISIDMNNVGNWANKQSIAYTTMMDLSLNDKVVDLIKREIRKINDRLPEKMRLQRFVLLPKELHPDDDELTRTRKLKRNVIDERYHSVVEALNSGDSYHDLDVTIRYMDGGTSRLKSKLRLEEV